jgi:hypothetical protein
VLVIGNQEVEGKVETMKQPMAVFRKCEAGEGSGSMVARADASAVAGVEHAPYSLEVVAIVRRRILFNKRPKPIITKAGTS